MISHVRFDLQVMPTSQHLWLRNNQPGPSPLFRIYVFFVPLFLSFVLSISLCIHSCVVDVLFLYSCSPCHVLFCFVRFVTFTCVRYSFRSILFGRFLFYTWSTAQSVERVKKTHRQKSCFVYAQKWKQAFKTNLYIVGPVCVCLFTTYQPNNLAWQQHTPNKMLAPS